MSIKNRTTFVIRPFERETGIEPATPTLARWCSTAEPLAHLPLSATKVILHHFLRSVNNNFRIFSKNCNCSASVESEQITERNACKTPAAFHQIRKSSSMPISLAISHISFERVVFAGSHSSSSEELSEDVSGASSGTSSSSAGTERDSSSSAGT